jgi:hypothetical protein
MDAPGLAGQGDQPTYEEYTRILQKRLASIRFTGLDMHEHCLVVIGVYAELNQMLGPRRAELRHPDSWMRRTPTRLDAVVSTRLSTNLPICPMPPLDQPLYLRIPFYSSICGRFSLSTGHRLVAPRIPCAVLSGRWG